MATNTMAAEMASAGQALRTPRAAAVAGILFSLLAGTSLVLVRVAVPGTLRQVSGWETDPTRRTAVVFALTLVPFAGIAFLWFIGVVRARIGEREDRFFATVFLGSGLLFVAMLFVSSALAGGLLAMVTSTLRTDDALVGLVWQYGSQVTYSLMTIYAMRMAGVFMISTATISLQIGIMPRWITVLGYLCAAILLVSVGYLPLIELMFPAWVLLVSTYILIASTREPTRPKSGLSNPDVSNPPGAHAEAG